MIGHTDTAAAEPTVVGDGSRNENSKPKQDVHCGKTAGRVSQGG